MHVCSRNRAAASLLAVVLTGVLLAVGAASARADPTPWGTGGAVHSGGVLCTLADGTRVPMAQWQVDGRAAFATADVVGTPAGDWPAPVDGTFAPLTGRTDSAVLAELITRYGTSSPARTAEVSALVAAAFGGGAQQARCLGQQGTSAADGASLRADAERYAGPYLVTATAPAAGPPGTAAPVAVTVRSATGVPVPGVAVTVAGGGQSATGSTSADGVATVSLTTPRAAQTPVVATVLRPTGLLLAAGAAGTPGAVVPAPPTSATASTVLAADLHPRPTLHVDVGGGLVAAGSSITATAQVSGTYGFGGSGTVTLAGPARPGADGRCSTLPAAAFAAAPNAWSQTFAVAGDGAVPVGTSPVLRAGCYVAGGSVTVTGAGPAATAGAPFEDAGVVDVIPLSVRRTPVPVLALPGRIAGTVTVDGADDASVTSAATVLGPVAPVAGRCDAVPWTGAPVLGTVDPAPHPPADGDARSVLLRTPALTALGCYAVRVTTTITQDGRTLTVQTAAGSSGTVVLVLRPHVTVADATYDTTRGTPMAGRVTVTGTYRYPGTVTVRLRASPPRFDGCRSVSFPTAPSAVGGAAAMTSTSGDGTFAFRTPAPPAVTCYAVEASLQMADAAEVRVTGPAPSAATIFLAGRPAEPARGLRVLHRAGSTARAGVTLLVAVLLMLALSGAVVVRTAGRHRARARVG